jgi:hypothetical protein
MDVYPGLDLGLRNFGARRIPLFLHRWFGLYAEAGAPIAKYGGNAVGNKV